MIKKIFSLIVAIVLMAAVPASARKPGEKVGLEFPELSYDFGTIEGGEGKYVVHEFTFNNTGDGAVAVISAIASCGCTRPEYTRKPVAPGKTGKVKVTFNTAGQKGEINKDIKLRLRSANGKSEQVTLRIAGVVVPPTAK
ncbi:MAG: DUF1573 domain-containing protein [Muribaculaceae bacterium]|nr:DUF1573 domain-containing protein [Muribaculaceae bacterium]